MAHSAIVQLQHGPKTKSNNSSREPLERHLLSQREMVRRPRMTKLTDARTPDCTAVLTTAEDHVLRVLSGGDLSPSLEARQPDTVHAAVWHPAASASTPEAFCFAASVRDTPVRLVDAADGRIRASYPIVDHRERFIAPHSLAFNVGADK